MLYFSLLSDFLYSFKSSSYGLYGHCKRRKHFKVKKQVLRYAVRAILYLKIATIAKCEGKAYGDDLNIEIVKACEREYRQKSDKKITLWL